ncbi:uncharacterized protein LOC143352541 isoform X2 [Halictus rubicundus]|uniref:uncharacterized protein LOC143352541 isoform X2 n=1 Tax=Halictus rubicundus TaxID=77578 RepID=UPI0040361333
MKLVILLLLSCCAVALAKPDGSKEVPKVKHGSKEVKHGSKELKHSGSGESKETSEGSSEGSSHESHDKSSNESGGGHGIILPEPNVKQVELLLDHVVNVVATMLGLHPVNTVRELVNLVKSNPLGSIVWKLAVHPYIEKILDYFQRSIISIMARTQSMLYNYLPFLQLIVPLELPKAIIHFVLSILSNISKIFATI